VYTDLQGDLLRRDFTVNALAVDLHPDRFGELNDPYGGISDLKAKLLKTPLNPDVTFSEDPLRMMRAAYFAAALDFTIDEQCFNAIHEQAQRISIVSQERVTAELIKILSTNKPSIGLIILQKTGLMKYVFPEIDDMYGLEQTKEWHHKDIFYHTMQVVDNAAQLSDKMKLRFAALVHDIAKPKTRKVDSKKGYTFHGHDAVGERILNKVAKYLKLPNELRDYLKKLTLLHLRPIAIVNSEVTDSAIRRVIVAAGDEIDDLMTLCRADITTRNPNRVKKYLQNFEIVESKMSNVEERDAMRAFQSPVRGKEIMQSCGLSEGKEVGKIKQAIEEAILNGDIENEYEAAKEYMFKIKDEILTD
jgi:putative nucleotidyltransferase with HDIG domain